jgi:hypothetical protein
VSPDCHSTGVRKKTWKLQQKSRPCYRVRIHLEHVQCQYKVRENVPHDRGVKFKLSFAQVTVKTSLESSRRVVPSSPGAKSMSNSRTNLATTTRSSLRASCFPMHAKRPLMKGNQADLSMTKSGRVDHLSGIKSSGFLKALGAAKTRQFCLRLGDIQCTTLYLHLWIV